MKETQEILLKMGFKNHNRNVWTSDWFGYFILIETATPEDLAKFIYNRQHPLKTNNETSEVANTTQFITFQCAHNSIVMQSNGQPYGYCPTCRNTITISATAEPTR